MMTRPFTILSMDHYYYNNPVEQEQQRHYMWYGIGISVHSKDTKIDKQIDPKWSSM